MTGPEHYREAERLLDLMERPVPDSELGWMARAQAAAEAQVHATLATAAAFLAVAVIRPDDRDAWDQAMGITGVTPLCGPT